MADDPQGAARARERHVHAAHIRQEAHPRSVAVPRTHAGEDDDVRLPALQGFIEGFAESEFWVGS